MVNLKVLALIRKAKGISQAEIGEALGKDESNYCRMENGKYEMRVKELPIIAKALGVPVMDLVQAIFFDNDAA
jgi:transcriptional regulator with XRE-family HTH domain